MEGVVEVKAGESVTAKVVESDCVIAEEDASVQGAALTTSYSVNGGAPASEPPTVRATRGDGANPTVTVHNHYAELRGDFAVVKTVKGADAGDREFVFTYTCTDADKTSGTMRVRADGQPVNAGVSLPKDTTCTVVEQSEGTEIEGYTLSELGRATVTITADAIARAEIENTYTPAPAPEPSPSATTESPAPEPSPSATTEAPAPEPSPSAITEAPVPEPSPRAGGDAAAPPSSDPVLTASAGAPSAGGSSKKRPALARTGADAVLPALLSGGTVLVGLTLLRARSRQRG